MGNEKVLLYRFHGTEAAKKLQPVLLRMGIRVKSVEPEEYDTPLGLLAGIKGMDRNVVSEEAKEAQKMQEALKEMLKEGEREATGEKCVDNQIAFVEISAPMMVMCGFSGKRVDELLQQMRKAGVPRIDLKAMLTPTNQYWTSRELFRELQKEDQMMKAYRQKS